MRHAGEVYIVHGVRGMGGIALLLGLDKNLGRGRPKWERGLGVPKWDGMSCILAF